MNNTIATTLLCDPAAILPEYEKPVCSLAARYVTGFSLSGLYKMDFDITYNRACNLVKNHLANNPAFSLDTFEDFINTRTLFYGVNDIQKVIAEYKRDPDAAFPYVLCFFSRKLCSFKKNKVAYTKGLAPEEVDSVLVIALYKTLEAYDFSSPFSFAYLDLELFAALTELGGQMHPFGLNRNDYVNYLKLSYLIHKYQLTPEALPLFLKEINASLEELPLTERRFPIEAADLRYSCKVSLKKALDFYSLYSIEHLGFLSDFTYDSETETMVDNTGSAFETGYSDVELNLFASQVLPDEKDRKVFSRLSEPEGAVFTNRELAEDYQYTRYALSKLKKTIFREIL